LFTRNSNELDKQNPSDFYCYIYEPSLNQGTLCSISELASLTRIRDDLL